MTQNANTQRLSDLGVSIWLDDLSRDRLTSGSLAALIAEKNVVGVTTNPAIFQAAIMGSASYAPQIKQLVAAGTTDVDAVITALTTDDVREACDLFQPIYDATQGFDGRVSIEVDPRLAHDTENTVKEAAELAQLVGRENVLIKIPATLAGLPAITAVIGAGISVNVTLIFSIERYRAVMDAYLAGLELAAANGHDLSKIHSVASFFVSRVDTEIDKRLEALGTEEAAALKGQAGVANAQLAYQAYGEVFGANGDSRFAALDGANPQRALWASTGVKDPAYSPVLYVDNLVGPQVVNTMPEKTLDAAAAESTVTEETLTPNFAAAAAVIAAVEAQGISLTEVTELLETEGVAKFADAWGELLDVVTTTIADAA
ncbi:transaldolase [Micrococcales bacterium 31B]|nr:transaldolase [Micrococcales bacterium 31B]